MNHEKISTRLLQSGLYVRQAADELIEAQRLAPKGTLERALLDQLADAYVALNQTAAQVAQRLIDLLPPENGEN
jgi:hypothetical protein